MEKILESHHEEIVYQEIMNNLYYENIMIYFKNMNPKLTKDGNQWCCLYGENIQEGIAGFGDTPNQAIERWFENLKWKESD